LTSLRFSAAGSLNRSLACRSVISVYEMLANPQGGQFDYHVRKAGTCLPADLRG
jgi:hypothetical protein